jgi:DNA-binding transcriptional regulator of glucitol operon
MGAIVLISLPASSFKTVAPSLIIMACALILLQPLLSRIMSTQSSHVVRKGFLELGVFLAGVNGGYFGVAALVFVAVDSVLWLPAGLLAVGSMAADLASLSAGD